MSISFNAKEEYFTFNDPSQNGKLIERKTEIRIDPLTQESSRIIFDPGAPFIADDYTELASQTMGKKCPFCTENVLSITPTFPDEVISSGRYVNGESIAFPNLFPYSKHNAVIRMCDQHYVPLNEFTTEMIVNSFSTASTYLKTITKSDSATHYASVNWNYLPPSGGSILHPHIHVLASEHPTNYQRTIRDSSKLFKENQASSYFQSLIDTEKELNERWIGTEGTIDWIHAFAPKGHYDFIGILNAASLADLTNEDWKHLSASLTRFFDYFIGKGIASFNLALFIPLLDDGTERVHIRLIPRMTVGLLNTSDMNVFNFLHNEPLSLKMPEDVAKEVASYFTT